MLGAKPDAPVDENERARKAQELQHAADRKQRIAEAGGQLGAAAVRFLGELMPRPDGAGATAIAPDQLAGAVDTDAAGRPVLALTLPDRATLDGIAQLLGGLLARASATDAVLN